MPLQCFCSNRFLLCLEDTTAGTTNHLGKKYTAEYEQSYDVMRAFICGLSLWLMRRTQKAGFSYHHRSIRPLLIPHLSPIQCSWIWWSQADSLPFLQHSILITFLCFLPSFQLSTLCFLVIAQEKMHNRKAGRSVVLISWQFTPSWFWMTDNLLKYFIWSSSVIHQQTTKYLIAYKCSNSSYGLWPLSLWNKFIFGSVHIMF